MIKSAEFNYCNQSGNQNIISTIRAKITHFEAKYFKLKEATTILELAMWKVRMHENDLQDGTTHQLKKLKTDKSSIRRQCRVTCGADVVIRLVLPYIMTVADEESDPYVESDSYATSDDESSDSM